MSTIARYTADSLVKHLETLVEQKRSAEAAAHPIAAKVLAGEAQGLEVAINILRATTLVGFDAESNAANHLALLLDSECSFYPSAIEACSSDNFDLEQWSKQAKKLLGRT